MKTTCSEACFFEILGWIWPDSISLLVIFVDSLMWNRVQCLVRPQDSKVLRARELIMQSVMQSEYSWLDCNARASMFF